MADDTKHERFIKMACIHCGILHWMKESELKGSEPIRCEESRQAWDYHKKPCGKVFLHEVVEDASE